MARQAQIAKSNRKKVHITKRVFRCWKCGRNHGYMRKFKLCRICFRELAREGRIPGVAHSSW